jgi:hypothetical protein
MIMMTTLEKVKTRVVLDFDEDAAKNLDLLKDRLGSKTRTDLIRRALALLEFSEERKKDGYTMQFRKGKTITEISFL